MFLLAAYANMEPSAAKRQGVAKSCAPVPRAAGRQQLLHYVVAAAANFPNMTMDLLPDGCVSINGGFPHGEWRHEGDLLIVRWHWRSDEEKAKQIIYDPVVSGVMKSRVPEVRCSHMLIQVQFSSIVTGGRLDDHQGIVTW